MCILYPSSSVTLMYRHLLITTSLILILSHIIHNVHTRDSKYFPNFYFCFFIIHGTCMYFILLYSHTHTHTYIIHISSSLHYSSVTHYRTMTDIVRYFLSPDPDPTRALMSFVLIHTHTPGL
jgi:low temperature requirement protein LtrA